MSRVVRPKAVCICRQDDHILVQELIDPVGDRRFYCPFGGEIELGERVEDAVQRECVEELSTDLADVRLLGVLENRFT